MTTADEFVRAVRETSIRHVEHHAELDSTNALAVELLRPLLDAGPAVIIADQQTAGRGRGGNQWWSTSGALTMSLVLDAASLALPTEHLPLLSLCTGMAVRDGVNECLVSDDAQLKWPNDVLVGDRKIAGVLLETHSTTDGRLGVIVGIGINVNNSLAAAPAELQSTATSLFDLTGESLDLASVLRQLILRWDARVLQLQSDRAAACADWNEQHALQDTVVVLQSGSRRIVGRCLEIDADGRLIVESDGAQHAVTSGVIESWRKSASR